MDRIARVRLSVYPNRKSGIVTPPLMLADRVHAVLQCDNALLDYCEFERAKE